MAPCLSASSSCAAMRPSQIVITATPSAIHSQVSVLRWLVLVRKPLSVTELCSLLEERFHIYMLV